MLQKETAEKPVNYYVAVTNNVAPDFFSKTLQMPPEDITLFLSFCEADQRAKEILAQNNDFLLHDFLITKNTEFKSLTTFGK